MATAERSWPPRSMAMELPVRKSALAGSWYPGHPGALRNELERYLRAAPITERPGRLVGLVSPHAGLMYSGPVAAHGFALLRDFRELTVLLLGPSHRHGFEGVAVFDRGAWETPLGSAAVDEDLADSVLTAGPPFFRGRDVHRFEHSLEMQLPFLQHHVPAVRIVPMLMGWQTSRTMVEAAAIIAEACRGREVLLLASSDLSHYKDARVAAELDSRVVGDISALDPEGLMRRLEETPEHACGGGPIVTVMTAARVLGADRATVLRYGHSGEAGERDVSRVVGYVAAALWQSA